MTKTGKSGRIVLSGGKKATLIVVESHAERANLRLKSMIAQARNSVAKQRYDDLDPSALQFPAVGLSLVPQV